ncbi:hypothetical protein GE300_13070 [Rhodobacteraceae bacterium 2CG4]|uniref:Uncharacterized protein n=1 Tax=Halovulum marinum TaxID=2662447 RepID=A0A6L5Z1T7_9RHOB|nr:hypothetical protein [Halovulum marinum]MSU90536.1 hypothetical protein [Halovulum marinum]
MSAPHDSPEKQARRHKPALGGIALSLIVGGLFALLIAAWAILGGDDPDGAETRIEGLTGEEVEVEDDDPIETVPATETQIDPGQ